MIAEGGAADKPLTGDKKSFKFIAIKSFAAALTV